MEKKKKKKNHIVKILTLVIMVVLIFTLCVVPSLANSVNERENVEYICGGSPINMSYATLKPQSGSTVKLIYTGFAPAINQYIIETGSQTLAPAYNYGISGDLDFSIVYTDVGNAGANQFIYFDQPTIAPQWSTNTPCVARNYSEINSKGYNLTLGVYKPHSIVDADWTPYVYAQVVNVRYVYNVTYHEITPEGETSTRYLNIYKDLKIPVQNDYARIPLYNSQALNSDFFNTYASFTYHGENYACINSASILLLNGDNSATEGVYSTQYFIEPSVDGVQYTTMAEYQRRYREDLSIIGDTEMINVQFADVSFSSWIKKSVGAFMDFEIVPGISFAGVLAVLIGVPLLIWFLKLFAGG